MSARCIFLAFSVVVVVVVVVFLPSSVSVFKYYCQKILVFNIW